MKNLKNKSIYYYLLFFMCTLIFIPEITFGTVLVSGVDIIDKKMTVNLNNVTLSSVLRDIAKKTNIKFIVNENESNKRVSTNFKLLPIKEGLERILDKVNHSIIFGPEGDIQTVVILGAKTKSAIKLQKEFGTRRNRILDRTTPEGMVIHQTHDRTPPEGMVIHQTPDRTAPEGMVIHQSPDRTVPEGMVIHQTHDKTIPEGMIIY